SDDNDHAGGDGGGDGDSRTVGAVALVDFVLSDQTDSKSNSDSINPLLDIGNSDYNDDNDDDIGGLDGEYITIDDDEKKLESIEEFPNRRLEDGVLPEGLNSDSHKYCHIGH